MPPPKKDAFSDLFKTSLNALARGASGLSMLEQQRLKASKPTASNAGHLSPNPSHGVPPTGNNAVDDIFAIFDKPATPKIPVSSPASPASCLSSQASRNPSPTPPIPSHSALASDALLLHDDFTDLCVLNPPHQSLSPQPTVPDDNPTDDVSAIVEAQQVPETSRDGGLALLLEMGFSMSEASDAWDRAGPDIQACAEYLFSRLNSRSNSPTRRSNTQSSPRHRSRSSTPLLPDFMGASILSTANKLFVKSKQAVLLNIELLAQPAPRDGVPPWMRSANRYEIPTTGDNQATESELLSKEEWMQRREAGARPPNKNVSSSNRDHSGISYPKTTASIGLPPPRPRRPITRYEDPLPPRPRRANTENENSLPIRPRRSASKGENHVPQKQRQNPLIESEYSSPSLRPHSPLESNSVLHGHSPRSSPAIDVVPSTPVAPAMDSPIIAQPMEDDDQLVSTTTSNPAKLEAEIEASHDLLGLNEPSAPPPSSFRDSTPLNQFQHVDYDTAKLRAHAAFVHGNYADALIHYSTCMQSLPPRHELRIVIGSNLANVHKLLGELKQSLECVDTATNLIGPDQQPKGSQISGKPIRYWRVKLLTCRAEVLELLERFLQCLAVYDTLVKEYGVREKKIADARARVNKIVNPQVHQPKKVPQKPAKLLTPASAPTPKPVGVSKTDASLSFEATERIAESIGGWSIPKKGNLRLLLVDLDQIVPPLISLLPKLRHLAGADVTLPKQVKAQYLRVISAIHPDKLALQCKQDPEAAQLGHEVFIVLSLAWDKFRGENNL